MAVLVGDHSEWLLVFRSLTVQNDVSGAPCHWDEALSLGEACGHQLTRVFHLSLHSTCLQRGCLFDVNCHLCPCPMFSRSLALCLVCAVEFLGIMWLLCTLEKFFYSDLCYSICDYLRKPNFDAVCVLREAECRCAWSAAAIYGAPVLCWARGTGYNYF